MFDKTIVRSLLQAGLAVSARCKSRRSGATACAEGNAMPSPTRKRSALGKISLHPSGNCAHHRLRCGVGRLGGVFVLLGLVATRADGQIIIADYPMNEASWSGPGPQVIDSTGNGHNGTAMGGATTISDPAFGQVGSFDGSDQYVIVSGSYPMSGAVDHGLGRPGEQPEFTGYAHRHRRRERRGRSLWY